MQVDCLPEKAMALHSSTLAWKIPWLEEPGGLQSMGSLRVGHDFTFTFHFHALEKEMATHSSVLVGRIPGMGKPPGLPSMGSQSQTWLKRLSSSSSLPPESMILAMSMSCLLLSSDNWHLLNIQRITKLKKVKSILSWVGSTFWIRSKEE